MKGLRLLAACSAISICASAPAQDSIRNTHELFPVKVDGKWGFIDASGKPQIAPGLSDVDEFGKLSDGFAIAAVDGKWGFINDKGEWVIKPQFHLAMNCPSALAAVETDDGKWQGKTC